MERRMTTALEPTPIHVPDDVLDGLRARLALTRPPLDEGNGDWSYGVPASYLRGLVAYWQDGYDWRKAEAAINAYEHAHDHGSHFIPWENPDAWVSDLRRTFHGRRA
jgi:epoxide hydrolase-like protein